MKTRRTFFPKPQGPAAGSLELHARLDKRGAGAEEFRAWWSQSVLRNVSSFFQMFFLFEVLSMYFLLMFLSTGLFVPLGSLF